MRSRGLSETSVLVRCQACPDGLTGAVYMELLVSPLCFKEVWDADPEGARNPQRRHVRAARRSRLLRLAGTGAATTIAGLQIAEERPYLPIPLSTVVFQKAGTQDDIHHIFKQIESPISMIVPSNSRASIVPRACILEA